MTTSQYLETVKKKYPNSYIGLNAFYKQQNPNIKEFMVTYSAVPLDYIISLIIKYIEYRNVNFLEALCNTQIDNITDTHDTLRLKTVTLILYRLENYINPVEGLPF